MDLSPEFCGFPVNWWMPSTGWIDILWIFCGLVDAIHWMDGYSVDFLWIGGCHPPDVWIFCGFSVD